MKRLLQGRSTTVQLFRKAFATIFLLVLGSEAANCQAPSALTLRAYMPVRYDVAFAAPPARPAIAFAGAETQVLAGVIVDRTTGRIPYRMSIDTAAAPGDISELQRTLSCDGRPLRFFDGSALLYRSATHPDARSARVYKLRTASATGSVPSNHVYFVTLTAR